MILSASDREFFGTVASFLFGYAVRAWVAWMDHRPDRERTRLHVVRGRPRFPQLRIRRS